MIETRIFKVQRPMATSDDEGYNQLLIYDEDRDIDQIWNASKEEMEQLFPNDELKTYWEGEVDTKKRQFWLTKPVEEQPW